MVLTYIIYIIVLFFSTTFCIINGFSKNKISKYLSISFSFFTIILFSSLRGENVGIDNPGYSEWYNYLNIEGSISEVIVLNLSTFEPAYVILNYIFKTFFFSYNHTLILYSILIWFPIFLYNEYYKKNFWILIYIILTSVYLFFTFNGIRQAIALGFIFTAVYFLKDKKFKYFFIFIIFASFFHFSSLLIISFYLIYKLRKQATILWLFAIIFS